MPLLLRRANKFPDCDEQQSIAVASLGGPRQVPLMRLLAWLRRRPRPYLLPLSASGEVVEPEPGSVRTKPGSGMFTRLGPFRGVFTRRGPGSSTFVR